MAHLQGSTRQNSTIPECWKGLEIQSELMNRKSGFFPSQFIGLSCMHNAGLFAPPVLHGVIGTC